MSSAIDTRTEAAWYRPAQSEAPWLRAVRAIRGKRIAVICIALIAILYGAATYTFLDIFGVDTGLQNPNAANLTERRPIRAGEDGGTESLGAFAARHGATLATLTELNPELVAEHGELRPGRWRRPGRSSCYAAARSCRPDLESPAWDRPAGPRHVLACDFRAAHDADSSACSPCSSATSSSAGGLGLLAGYRGGMVDTLIMRAADFVLALPGLVILLVLVSRLRRTVGGGDPRPAGGARHHRADRAGRA